MSQRENDKEIIYMNEYICPMTGIKCTVGCEARQIREKYFRKVEEVLKNKMEENPKQDRSLALLEAYQEVSRRIIEICKSK